MVTVRIDRSGAPLSDPVLVAQPWNVRNLDLFAAAAWNGHTLAIAYESVSVLGFNLWAKFTDASGAPIDPEPLRQREQLVQTQRHGIAIALSPAPQDQPSIATSKTGTLGVWIEPIPEEGKHGLFASLHTEDAAPGGRGFLIKSSEFLSNAHVAFSGDRYLVVWTASDGMNAAFISVDGALLSTISPVPLASAGDVAWDGSTFVVANRRVLGTARGGDISAVYLLRISENVFSSVPVSQASQTTSAPAIASNGETSLLTWVRGGQVEAVIVSHAAISGVFSVDSEAIDSSVSWNGRAYVIGILLRDNTVRWQLVNPEGMLLPSYASPIPGTTAPFRSAPRGARLGETMILTWPDGDSIRGAQIRGDGSLIGEVFTIAAADSPRYVSLASEAIGIRLIYRRESAYPGVPRLTRVFTRFIDAGAVQPRRRAAGH